MRRTMMDPLARLIAFILDYELQDEGEERETSSSLSSSHTLFLNRFNLPHLCTVAIDIVHSRRAEKHEPFQLHRPGYRDGTIPFEKLNGVQESGDRYLPRDENNAEGAGRKQQGRRDYSAQDNSDGAQRPLAQITERG